MKIYSREWRHRNYSRWYQQIKAHNKKKYKEMKFSILQLLGGRCSNPDCLVPGGCTDFRCLQLDHINNDGNNDRKRFINSWQAYSYYVKHVDEAKQQLQILCANCNWIKEFDFRYRGYIPSEEK